MSNETTTEGAVSEVLTDDELAQVTGGTDGTGAPLPPPRPQL